MKGLYGKFYERLKEVGKIYQKNIIPFPYIFEKICRNFSIKKRECWEILLLFRDIDLIEIVPFHGIKIK